MKGLISVGLALLVMGLSFWAYRENYATQASLGVVRGLKAEIAATQAHLDRLNAEWAYLNRPDRLRDLAELNFRRLELLPLRPEAFAGVEQVAMPPAPGAVASELIVSSEAPGGTEEPL
ncbi:cell division protein FtsL [Rubellimicrobium aerolatum]|uniref:Cell division protein FtsL n=1 Tax=Rubellimicrobium aerolatum TaxID=490979 RepID=A0ABW0S685_9RHOB|nr:cell division protein FtsL [Rubellimicrobium aerolatum]MBP1804622.1 hypothetical protein [Rubellimicrobium aerolatum]